MATMYTRNCGDRYPDSSPHTVNFHDATNRDEYLEEKKKYLTAKYGQHQMKLIRKRLAVEDWLDKELKSLYGMESETETYDCEIDIDELLDMEEDTERKQFVRSKVASSGKSPDVINKFIDELLAKAATL